MLRRALFALTLLPWTAALASVPLEQGADLPGADEGDRDDFDLGPVQGGDLEPHGIWNGTTAPTFTSVGTLVALWPNDSGYEFCSGTLVHPLWFVTAAHCITAAEDEVGNGATIYVVWNQDIHSNEAWKYRKVVQMFRNPGYQDNAAQIRDDIAVVKLESAAPVPTQGVLLDNPDTYKGEKLTYVGYGIISSQQADQDTSGVRRKTEMTLQGCVAPDYFYNNYPCGAVSGDPDYEPQFLYSEESGHNICSGDSGGAAMKEMDDGTFLLVGVNSYTSGNCESGESGAARIDYYEDWLESKMGVQLVSTVTQPTDTGSDDTGTPDTGGDDTGDDPDDTGGDTVLDDTGLTSDPERPPEGAYDGGFLGLCQTGPAVPSAMWLAGMIGLVPLMRRRRS